jgi:hypothetical protein
VAQEPEVELRENVVHFLANQIPQVLLADIRMLMQNKQTPWHLAAHFGLGLRVRNSLREAGFGFDDVWLDDHWFELVEEAAGRT